jgi:hypothetical protein
MRRAVVWTIALTAVVLGLTMPALCQSAPDHVLLTWTADPATTQTITWRMNGASAGIVEYEASGRVKTASATPRELVTDQGTVRLFTATLTGLSRDTRYSYRVGDGTVWTEYHIFTTAGPEAPSVKFLIFGDSQSGVKEPIYGPWSENVHAAFKANPDARFMVNLGDLVEIGQNIDHWNAWFEGAKGVIDTIPDMAVEGNHETYGMDPKAGSTKPRFWAAQFPLPQNGPTRLKNQVYSYDYGQVHIVVLDSQQYEEKPKYGDILETQKAWVDADLTASKAQWNLVFFHRTPYYSKATRSNDEIREKLCPILEKHHVDVVFNGHDHAVARTFPIMGGNYMKRPSQGTIYYIAGRGGAKTYSDLEKKPWNTFFYNPLDQPNYLVVEVAGKKLTIRAVKQDGTLIDEFYIDKQKDVTSDKTAH